MKSSNQDSDIKVPEAMKLIHNQDGRAVSSSARSAPRDAYFAFLLLRHLRIREMRTKVGGGYNSSVMLNGEKTAWTGPDQIWR